VEVQVCSEASLSGFCGEKNSIRVVLFSVVGITPPLLYTNVSVNIIYKGCLISIRNGIISLI
jgi:hypothetical protein